MGSAVKSEDSSTDNTTQLTTLPPPTPCSL